ncbi:hypothetical protein Pmani_040013 [Petrolisthes manimaculis]|uniref:Uncharacterized protein n=1 Tax=Petrolisthes manimaculis TaxID=1843537 RepID=A0AAE1NBF5_9EUCA|nr:hypothetical protein Pmani_040013 [Petrolisthes manimaculis]
MWQQITYIQFNLTDTLHAPLPPPMTLKLDQTTSIIICYSELMQTFLTAAVVEEEEEEDEVGVEDEDEEEEKVEVEVEVEEVEEEEEVVEEEEEVEEEEKKEELVG